MACCQQVSLANQRSWCNDVQMQENDIDFYDHYGYAVINNVLSFENCDKLQEMAAPYADEQHSVLLNIHRTHPVFTEIVRHPTIVNAVKSVQRSTIVALNSQYLFKKSGTPYAKQSWTPHQDNSYPKAKNGTYIIAHLSLERSDPENGGLIFWPRSHQEDILEFEHNKSWKEEFDANGVSHPGQTVKIPDQYKPMDMYLPKGSLCLMHGNLIHGSHPNFSSRSRPQYSMAFLNRGERFDVGKTSIKEYMEVEAIA